MDLEAIYLVINSTKPFSPIQLLRCTKTKENFKGEIRWFEIFNGQIFFLSWKGFPIIILPFIKKKYIESS
jgi:hypothetical protein